MPRSSRGMPFSFHEQSSRPFDSPVPPFFRTDPSNQEEVPRRRSKKTTPFRNFRTLPEQHRNSSLAPNISNEQRSITVPIIYELLTILSSFLP
ncbi:MAG: hypothetical protein ACYCYP_11835 [Leptospirales bacterium]